MTRGEVELHFETAEPPKSSADVAEGAGMRRAATVGEAKP
jgi:hypothetical protein